MGERVHTGTMISGLVVAVVGAAFTAEGFGWWNFELGDLRYLGPIFVILFGLVMLFLALFRRPNEG